MFKKLIVGLMISASSTMSYADVDEKGNYQIIDVLHDPVYAEAGTEIAEKICMTLKNCFIMVDEHMMGAFQDNRWDLFKPSIKRYKLTVGTYACLGRMVAIDELQEIQNPDYKEPTLRQWEARFSGCWNNFKQDFIEGE